MRASFCGRRPPRRPAPRTRTRFARRCAGLPHVLPRVGLLTAFCLLVHLFNQEMLSKENKLIKLDPLGHTVLGVALSLLTVFRTNSAYARFWEARTLWGGIVNTSRNL